MASGFGGTRKYGAGSRVAIGASATTSASAVSPGEVMLAATADCYVRFGGAAATAEGGIPMSAGEKFHLQAPSGTVSVIGKDGATGHLHIFPVI